MRTRLLTSGAPQMFNARQIMAQAGLLHLTNDTLQMFSGPQIMVLQGNARNVRHASNRSNVRRNNGSNLRNTNSHRSNASGSNRSPVRKSSASNRNNSPVRSNSSNRGLNLSNSRTIIRALLNPVKNTGNLGIK